MIRAWLPVVLGLPLGLAVGAGLRRDGRPASGTTHETRDATARPADSPVDEPVDTPSSPERPAPAPEARDAECAQIVHEAQELAERVSKIRECFVDAGKHSHPCLAARPIEPPVSWPPEYQLAALQERASAALREIGEGGVEVSVDCSEYPCLVLVPSLSKTQFQALRGAPSLALYSHGPELSRHFSSVNDRPLYILAYLPEGTPADDVVRINKRIAFRNTMIHHARAMEMNRSLPER